MLAALNYITLNYFVVLFVKYVVPHFHGALTRVVSRGHVFLFSLSVFDFQTLS